MMRFLCHLSRLRGRFQLVLLAAAGALLLTLAGAGPAAAAPAAASCDDACKIAAAQAYLDSLVTHDADDVPFAPNATRTENGFNTGRSGEEIRHDLNTSPKYWVIMRLRDLEVSVSGDTVTTDYVLDVGIAGVQLGSSRVHETFLIRNGKILTIIATFDIALGTWSSA